MVTIPLKCPHFVCESTDVGKHGVSAVGKKRYACRNTGCGKTFQEDYSFKGYQPGTRSEIYFMTVNGNGVRATARIPGISKDTVIATLRSFEPSLWYVNHTKSTKRTNFSASPCPLQFDGVNFNALGAEGQLFRNGGAYWAFAVEKFLYGEAYEKRFYIECRRFFDDD